MIYKASRSWHFFRPEEHLISDFATSTAPGPVDDESLVRRIIEAYGLSNITEAGRPENFWETVFGPKKKYIHDALMSKDVALVTAILRNPSAHMLFYGFEQQHSEYPDGPSFNALQARYAYDALRRLGEAVGALLLEYPEGYVGAEEMPVPPPVEDILVKLDSLFGFRIEFPNPYPNETSLATSRGVATYRAIQSLFQAYGIFGLSEGKKEFKVVEIGAGLGRNAFFSDIFGVRDYTIIDIPMTGVAQAYFLGRALGPDKIQLFGERTPAQVKIMPPKQFLETDTRYDLGVNIDSFPEMHQGVAIEYIGKISESCDSLLSINHECYTLNSTSVRHYILDRRPKSLTRTPYWLRPGYVEEIAVFRR